MEQIKLLIDEINKNNREGLDELIYYGSMRRLIEIFLKKINIEINEGIILTLCAILQDVTLDRYSKLRIAKDGGSVKISNSEDEEKNASIGFHDDSSFIKIKNEYLSAAIGVSYDSQIYSRMKSTSARSYFFISYGKDGLWQDCKVTTIPDAYIGDMHPGLDELQIVTEKSIREDNISNTTSVFVDGNLASVKQDIKKIRRVEELLVPDITYVTSNAYQTPLLLEEIFGDVYGEAKGKLEQHSSLSRKLQ